MWRMGKQFLVIADAVPGEQKQYFIDIIEEKFAQLKEDLCMQI